MKNNLILELLGFSIFVTVRCKAQVDFLYVEIPEETSAKALDPGSGEAGNLESPVVDIPVEPEDFLEVKRITRLNEKCVDPTFASGTCQPLENCPPLLEIAQHPELKNEYRLLQRSYCGKIGFTGLQLFCCRSSFTTSRPQSTTSPSATRRTTTRSLILTSVAPPKKCETSGELNSQYCGITNRVSDRIVGGNEAPIGAWPWAVLLSEGIANNNFFCGGSLITNNHVLTAAHCLGKIDENNLFVRLAEHNTLSTRDGRTTDIKVEKVMLHEGYSTTNQDNDIAILFLSRGVCFKDRIRPVCLADRKWQPRNLTSLPTFVVGWGVSDFNQGTTSSVLNEVILKIIDKNRCVDAFKTIKNAPKNFDNIICAGDDGGGKDACQGDSGGPMVLPDATGKFHLVGIVSAGVGCGRRGFPGLYTRVSSFNDWIVGKLNS